MNHIAKINISRVMTLFGFPIWLSQEALYVDQRDASRRVSLLRSLIIKSINEFMYFRTFVVAFIFQFIRQDNTKTHEAREDILFYSNVSG